MFFLIITNVFYKASTLSVLVIIHINTEAKLQDRIYITNL